MADQPHPPLPEWSVDQVVYEFCHNEEPPWVLRGLKPIPNKEQLEETLRSNDVDGTCLIEISYEELKTDLNITSLGQRKAFEKALRFLRGDTQPSATPGPLSIYEKIHKYQEGVPTPDLSRHSPYAPSMTWQSVTDQQVPRRLEQHNTHRIPHLKTHEQPLRAQSTPAIQQDSLQVHLGSQQSTDDPLKNEQPITESGVANILDTLDASIDRNLRPVDSRIPSFGTESQNKLEASKALVVKPKRRIAPTFVRPLQKQPERQAIRTLHHGQKILKPYLSKNIVSMQDTFYGDDSDYDSDGELLIVSDGIPSGSSRAIYSRLKHFFGQKAQATNVLPYEAFIKLPYPVEACAGPVSEPQFTLFVTNVLPSTQKLSDWSDIARSLPKPAVKAARSKQASDVIVAVREFGSFEQANKATTDETAVSNLGNFAYLLEKYPVNTAEEDPLPVYGDSGDENDFDEETWQEIGEERQDQVASNASLTQDEAQTALMEAVDEIREKWRLRKLPKAQLKAYRLWMKLARAKKRAGELDAYYALRSHKLASLTKMKDLILKDTWRKTEDVKAQCDVLEETVYTIMEAEYMLETLHKNTPPPKPDTQPIKPRTRTKPVLPTDEESLDSDSELEAERPMANFIVDDDGDAPMLDDPRDHDWDPSIPKNAPKPIAQDSIDRNLAESATMEKNQPFIDDPSDVVDKQDQEMSTVADGPSPDDNKSIHDDADAESDGPSDPIISPRRKAKSPVQQRKKPLARPTKQGPYHAEDWSPSSPASPNANDSEADNSDFDLPRLPQSQYKRFGKTRESAIELTSSPTRAEYDSTGGNTSVATPPLNPAFNDSDEAPLQGHKHILTLKLHPPAMRPRSSMSSSSADVQLPSHVSGLEACLRSIYERKPEEIERLQDIMLYNGAPGGMHMRNLLNEGLTAMWQGGDFTIAHPKNVPKNVPDISVWYITLAFMSFAQMKDLSLLWSQADIAEPFEKRIEYNQDFVRELKKALKPFGGPERVAQLKNLRKQTTRPKKRKHSETIFRDTPNPEDPDETELDPDIPQETPHKKRKKQLEESQEAKEIQKSDRARIVEQESRRQLLMAKMGQSDGAITQVVVNTTEPLVQLNGYIASRVKPHQINGIQFLWREIVDDPRQQGCLLAHTMGLGKTMQVISLLVTIAQCSTSGDQDLVNHVPKHLRENKTLILCPPSLIENWYDELLMWSPYEGVLGEIYKISGGTARLTPTDDYFRRWATDGGVLVMGYETFRSFLKPAKNLLDHAEKVPQYKQWLLETPTLVVADEAHKLKNPKSIITGLCQLFKTKSRIALTGSPLNNHLEEYHTMIEWIAPGYLGDIGQFRQKYIDPINEGLYADSSAYERRLCLRRLHTLKKDIDPKVNRADITAIRKDMPPKTEYIITIPLVDAQRVAYDVYVSHLLDLHDTRGKTGSSGLLKWLSNMVVLAAHPSCFVKVFQAHEELSDKAYESSTDAEASDHEARDKLDEFTDEYDPLAAKTISKSDLDAERAAVEIFDGAAQFGGLQDPALSYRTLITQKLVQKAIDIGDKILVFSHSIPTLDYLEEMLKELDPALARIDGSTKISERQKKTKDFNGPDGANSKVFLISTKAGGLGLNLQGANRVIIFDSGFNPMWEEQAVGRAYRLGQTRDVFVYRFKCGGTFEEPIFNKALFKTQLFQRVVDKKNPTRAAAKSVSQYLFPSKDVKKRDFQHHLGRDPLVLDEVIDEVQEICNLELTETFQRDDGEELNEEELKLANDEQEDERMRREEPEKWKLKHGFARTPAPYVPRGGSAAVTGQGSTQPGGKVKTFAATQLMNQRVKDGKEEHAMTRDPSMDEAYSRLYSAVRGSGSASAQNDGAVDLTMDSDSADQSAKNAEGPAGCNNQ